MARQRGCAPGIVAVHISTSRRGKRNLQIYSPNRLRGPVAAGPSSPLPLLRATELNLKRGHHVSA